MNEELKSSRLLLTSKEAAAQLSICERTLYTLTKSKQIAAVRIGRGVRYSPGDLQKFIESQREHAVE